MPQSPIRSFDQWFITGQIRPSTPFGRCLQTVAKDMRYTRYLEVGTWNGRGSTACFYEGFRVRRDQPLLQSYEINRPRVAEAAAHWAAVPQLQILYGRVLTNEQCPTYEEVSARFPQARDAWHAEDIQNFWAAPYIAPRDPEVVLLDGAEYLTWFEFDRVFRSMPSVRVFLLDDTQMDKTREIAATLTADPAWKRVAGSDTERSGWAMFERRP